MNSPNIKQSQERLILTAGNTQVGKSSFINFIAENEVAPIGGYGQSATLNVHKYGIGQASKLFPEDNTSTLSILDVPGFRDSDIRKSDEAISKDIIAHVLMQESFYIDAILLFESCSADSNSNKVVLNDLMNIFGSNIKESIIIVTTKWDKLDEDEYILKEKYFNDLKKNFKCVKWINLKMTLDRRNRWESFALEIYDTQITNLISELRNTKPYDIRNIGKLNDHINLTAKKLKETNPDRYTIQHIKFDKEVPYEVEETKNIDVTEKKYKTESEIQKRAEELQRLKGKRNVCKQRQAQRTLTTPYTEYILKPKIVPVKYKTSAGWITFEYVVDQIVYEKVPETRYTYTTENYTENYNEMEFYPISEFIEQAKNEIWTVNRPIKQKVTRTKKVQDTLVKKIEAFSDDHYVNLAKQEIALEYRNACRSLVIG